jgi:hypothetical protein
MGYGSMIVELGTLYTGDANRPNKLAGTLFRFDVSAQGLTGTFNLAIAADTLRGGVVNQDGNAITATFNGTPVVFTGCTVPDLLNPAQTKAQAEAAIVAAGYVVGTETGVFSDVIPVGQVTAQSPAAGSTPDCGTAVTLSYVCRTVTCKGPRCTGDVDGDGWVRSTDITALVTLIGSYPSPTYRMRNTDCRYDACADVDGDTWVRSTDITALVTQLGTYPSPSYRCHCGAAACPTH